MIVSENYSWILFGLSGVLIMIGLVFQVQSIMNKAIGKTGYLKFFSIITKYLGLSFLAYLIYIYKTNNIVLNMIVFLCCCIATFLLYLLARRSALR